MCDFEIPRLLYYAYIPILASGFLFSVVIFLSRKKAPEVKGLLGFIILFCGWIAIDFFSWLTTDIDTMLLLAQVSVLTIFSLFFFLTFTHAFVGDKLSWKKKILYLLPFVPFGLLIFTKYNVQITDVATCTIEQGPLYLYLYAVMILYTFLSVKKLFSYYRTTDKKETKTIIRIIFFALIFLVVWFLIVLLLVNYLKGLGYEQSDQLALFAPVGIIAFIGAIVYAITRYRFLNIKLIGAQVLVTSLIIVIASQFFFVTNKTNIVLTCVSLSLIIVFGYFLIRSVQKEISTNLELAKLSKTLAEKNKHLKELMDMKSDFLAIASHQLRTPLTVAYGLMDMFSKGDFDKFTKEKQREYQNKVLISIDRLRTIVNDLLKAMESEGGNLKLEFVPVNLGKMLKDIVDELKLAADQKKITITLKIPEGENMIMADETYTRQVFTNMIDNAIKYSLAGQAIEIFLTQENDHMTVAIQDHGIGLSDEGKKKLFEKFYRAPEAKKVKASGTGLGLFIARRIVEDHSGSITLDSAGLGKGTTATITLPIKQEKTGANFTTKKKSEAGDDPEPTENPVIEEKKLGKAE